MEDSLLRTDIKLIIFLSGFVIASIIGLIIDYRQDKRRDCRYDQYGNEQWSNNTAGIIIAWVIFSGLLLAFL